MYWDRTLLTRCLLSLLTLGLLQSALGYVAQSPNEISQSTPELGLVTASSSLAASPNE